MPRRPINIVKLLHDKKAFETARGIKAGRAGVGRVPTIDKRSVVKLKDFSVPKGKKKK